MSISDEEREKLGRQGYGGFPPHQPVDTSIEAAGAIKPKAKSLRTQVYEWVKARGHLGATQDEIEHGMPMHSNTAAPRRCELRNAGMIVHSGRYRKTRAGNRAIVWVAKDFAPEAPPDAPKRKQGPPRAELLATIRRLERELWERCEQLDTERIRANQAVGEAAEERRCNANLTREMERQGAEAIEELEALKAQLRRHEEAREARAAQTRWPRREPELPFDGGPIEGLDGSDPGAGSINRPPRR